MTFSLTSLEQKQAFEADGVVCLRNQISPEEIEKLRLSIDRQTQGVSTSPTAYDFENIADQLWAASNGISAGEAARFEVNALAQMILADPTARPLQEPQAATKSTGSFVYDASGWRHDDGIRELALDSVLPQLASELLGSECVNFWEDTTFVKTPNTRQKTAFHQDLGYNHFEGEQSIVFWIALDDVDQENGGMRYVRGSHKWGQVYAPNMFVAQTTMPGAQAPKVPDIEADEGAYDLIHFDVKPGDIIAHHVLCVHGAGGNMTSRQRRAISFQYCGDDVRYFERPGAAPRAYTIDKLNNGDRLYSRDFPTVWPRPWPGVKLSNLYGTMDLLNLTGHPARTAA